MSSETYKRFLESQAEKNPVKMGDKTISWEDGEKSGPSDSSNLLESIYLGREPEETVVVDRETVVVLRERLARLEGEVNRLHRRSLIMKALIAALAGILGLLAIWVLSSTLVPLPLGG